jgi:hypothetical protein
MALESVNQEMKETRKNMVDNPLPLSHICKLEFLTVDPTVVASTVPEVLTRAITPVANLSCRSMNGSRRLECPICS